MNSPIVKWVSGILAGLLVALILYGAYCFYFQKPTPIVNNTTVQPGATLNVEQAKTIKTGGRLYTGVSGGKVGSGTAAMLEIGWLW
jgi:hypothetical protein